MGCVMRAIDVSRHYGMGAVTVHALKDINIDIEEGGLTILRGRSGSGKTTLLNILGALDFPSQGQVFLDEEDIARDSESRRTHIRRKDMGFIFQSVALLSVMTAFENVEFGLRLAGFPASQRKERARQALGMVGLQKRLEHRTQELSGGEQQRVAIARAFAHKPRIIFADEPTAELDSHMAASVMKLFQTLVRDDKLTIVMSSHDPNIIVMADKVIELSDGCVIS